MFKKAAMFGFKRGVGYIHSDGCNQKGTYQTPTDGDGGGV